MSGGTGGVTAEDQGLWYWQAEFEAAKQHVPGGVYVRTQDLFEVLGPDADALLASVDMGVDQLIDLLNAKTCLLPRITDTDWAQWEERFGGELTLEPAATTPERSWKRRFVKAAVMATLLSLTGGGATAMAMDKAVTVDVDGHTRTVHTYAGTVGDVLARDGLLPGAHDAVVPATDSAIADGGKIVLQRGRQLHLTVDGKQSSQWVKATTLSGALRELRVPDRDVKLSADPNSEIPLGGMAVDLRTAKAITVLDGGAAPRQLTTHANSVQELLRELSITLGAEDSVSPAVQTPLATGAQVDISRNGVTVVHQNETIEAPVQRTEDPSMTVGQQKVDDPGAPGQKEVTYRVTTRNGREVRREQVGEAKVLTPPKPKVVRVGSKPEPVDTSAPNGAMWDRIARCESSGNWHAVSANGRYHGGLQFDHGTWMANGGGAYADNADGATREQQIAVANRVYAARGLGPWGCR
ncbi:resuscitation-promoting factor [Kutzneria viridogrisea]|uniref:Uncharacterized protein YabE (DUF348 family) n=1 Tax=Kutzneria viridogrisea TaxID=47990 RepID=A0ABR6B7Q6_9PSEU|nr:uncharacterized protein YabE (DUF348 family) [Kutzneria viridogrisea]